MPGLMSAMLVWTIATNSGLSVSATFTEFAVAGLDDIHVAVEAFDRAPHARGFLRRQRRGKAEQGKAGSDKRAPRNFLHVNSPWRLETVFYHRGGITARK